MSLIRLPSRVVAGSVLLVGFLTIARTSAQPEPPIQHSPWGVSASASSYRDIANWFPKMADAGVKMVRLFPEWRGFEPTKGTWKWENGDAMMKAAADHRLEISAVLMGSPPGTKAVHAFPMDNLDDWSAYVSAVVGRYHEQIRYWEVWNEGNGGFNDAKHTTTDYAKLATVTYTAAKKADPKAQIGLTVASFDAPYLNQTIVAMKKAGNPNSFDYLCIHPYEIADGLAEADGEIPFLWMNHTLREMLKRSALERANADIWITEIGHRIDKNRGITERDAAKALVKIYTMAMAQGIARTQWFEAQDPGGEDQGFGMLNRDGTPRESYKAMRGMTKIFRTNPKYVGWLALGEKGKAYGFVFETRDGLVLVAWTPVGLKSQSISLPFKAEFVRLFADTPSDLKIGESLEFSDEPVFVLMESPELAKQAKANASQPFPWGGDYSNAKSVSNGDGIFQVRRTDCPTVQFADGSNGIVVQGDIRHPVSFYVHPSFANFHTKEYYIRVTVRRFAEGNVGMNLIYQTADGQGRTPYANSGKWFGASKENGWQTHTWHVTDACFTKMWGYDFTLRPEQSIPFVIGKIEVSTEPFK